MERSGMMEMYEEYLIEKDGIVLEHYSLGHTERAGLCCSCLFVNHNSIFNSYHSNWVHGRGFRYIILIIPVLGI